MAFEIKNKVALISGGASGIGLTYAKELLKNGLRGVTLADINAENGAKALQEIQSQFGPEKAIFVLTDVSNINSYEGAFIKTIEFYKNLDILINNAGILNDKLWEKEIALNFNGVVHGMLLGLEKYIPKQKTGLEGVIVNMSSVAGVRPSEMFPIYSATKSGVFGMSQAFGDEAHYKRTNVKVLVICPGATETPMMTEMSGKTLGAPYQAILEAAAALNKYPMQRPESVARAMVHIVKNAKSGTAWIVENNQDPYEYIMPPRENFAPKDK